MEIIEKYCKFIEEMWSHGTEDVINIVEVTILERISDEEVVWSNFGSYISSNFKAFINETVLRENIMMMNVPKL